jgi:glycine/D-amino acid oxidase-like deaminating enzyme
MRTSPDVIVAGAGVMGVFVALTLRERGLDVALVDAWEPGNPLASSSSESRVIRALYGKDALYAEWSWKALHLWEQREVEIGRRLLYRNGVLWLAREGDGYEAAGAAVLKRLAIPHERLAPDEVVRRFPAFACDDLRFAILEPRAGALLARDSVRAMSALLVKKGGRLGRGAVEPGESRGGRLQDVRAGGERLAAGAFVFACGAWLGRLFPDLLGPLIRCCRAEELYFGVPAGGRSFDAYSLPSWVEIGAYYGIPSLDGRAFKVGIDRPGPEIDPTNGDRTLDPRSVEEVRAYLARRFPALKSAPLVDSRVCTYEPTPDEHLLLDRHPGLDNVFFAGGGSGHAFKLGPVIGGVLADLVTGVERETHARFRLGAREARGWRQA